MMCFITLCFIYMDYIIIKYVTYYITMRKCNSTSNLLRICAFSAFEMSTVFGSTLEKVFEVS